MGLERTLRGAVFLATVSFQSYFSRAPAPTPLPVPSRTSLVFLSFFIAAHPPYKTCPCSLSLSDFHGSSLRPLLCCTLVQSKTSGRLNVCRLKSSMEHLDLLSPEGIYSDTRPTDYCSPPYFLVALLVLLLVAGTAEGDEEPPLSIGGGGGFGR